MRSAIEHIKKFDHRYFGYIVTKYLLLKAGADNLEYLSSINERLRNCLISLSFDWKTDSESFLLLCAYLSSPDVSLANKRAVFQHLKAGSTISNAELEELGHRLTFVDWSGVSVKHILSRKALRPVYEWG